MKIDIDLKAGFLQNLKRGSPRSRGRAGARLRASRLKNLNPCLRGRAALAKRANESARCVNNLRLQASRLKNLRLAHLGA